MDRTAGLERPGSPFEYLWPIAASLLALTPFLRGFSTSDVFYVRDLGMYFWPRHLWAWRSFRAGDWPLWDPYAAGGQSAVADALNHFFLIPVAIVRAFTPAVVGFNFWVAAPFPFLAWGSWLWLRRHVSPPAAFVGAGVASIGGPILSAGNFPNLSWTMALVPWILWSVDRLCEAPGPRRFGALAAWVGLQAVSGEPVSFSTNGALVLAYTAAGIPIAGWTGVRFRLIRVVAAALGAGVLLAAIQLVPLVLAASRSLRGANVDHALFWSLHPLTLVETVVPHLFGHVYHANLEELPWMRVLNSGREPLLYSMYLGLPVWVLALVRGSGAAIRRWRLFWWSVLAMSLIGALGEFTPVYPAVQTILPVLKSFRFPIKYFLFGVLALAALAASGADSLITHHRHGHGMARPVAALTALALTGVVALGLGVGGLLQSAPVQAWWESLALLVDIDDPGEAVRWMQGATALWLRLVAIALVFAVLLFAAWRRGAGARLGTWAIAGLAVLDAVIVNADLHPTLPAALLGPPAWVEVTRAYPADRVYIGGRLDRNISGARLRGPAELIDSPNTFQPPAEWSVQESLTLHAVQYAFTPAAWGVRELISYDLPQLWPRDYVTMLRKVRDASTADRRRFLARTGTRFCFVPDPPVPGATPLSAPAISSPMALYQCSSDPRRVYVTEQAQVEPDTGRHLDLLLDERHDPLVTVLLDRPAPPPAGIAGAGRSTPSARVLRDANTELIVRASTSRNGGYLNVLDSYSPHWRVEVDGRPATLLRANGLFRAVWLAPGDHEVRFVYRPVPFYTGVAVTSVMAAGLLFACVRQARRRRHHAGPV